MATVKGSTLEGSTLEGSTLEGSDASSKPSPEGHDSKRRKTDDAAASSKETTLFDHVVNGEYEAAQTLATHFENTEEITDRITFVKFIEEREIEMSSRKETEVTKVNLKSTREVYRGYSFKTNEKLNEFMQDPHPWSAQKDGETKGFEMHETYLGMYVTAFKEQAEAYAGRFQFGVLVTFSWPVIRALFVLGEIDFDISNDIAYKTQDFSDEGELQGILAEDILPAFGVADLWEKLPEKYHDDAKKTHDYIFDTCYELSKDEVTSIFYEHKKYAIYWSLFHGRNNELCIGKVDDKNWDWNYNDKNVVKNIIFTHNPTATKISQKNTRRH